MTLSARPLVLGLLLLAAGPALAQDKDKKKPPPPPLKIDRVRLGLPTGGNEHRLRLGAWSPVYVDMTAGEDRIDPNTWTIIGEMADGDSQAQFTVSVPDFAAEEKRTVITYYRTADRGGKLTLTLKNPRGSTAQTVSAEPSFSGVVDPHEVLYLGLGAPLGGLRKALVPQKADDDGQGDQPERAMAFTDRVDLMPTHWLGYHGVDVVVMATGNKEFIKDLRQNERACAALGEWVRRGGRLVLSVGRTFQEFKELLPRMQIRDFTLEKTERVGGLPEVAKWADVNDQSLDQAAIDVVRFSAREGVVTLARAGAPVMALSPTGMGRVLLVAFDFDAAGFSRWKEQNQNAFWRKLNDEIAPKASRADGNIGVMGRGRWDVGERAELAASMQRGLESFDEVPVVSFGWVAFFILIYILIVGPLDYFFLKKVVKRLELTWITFPVVVLVVSVAAYFTAYKLKGNHMRINKVDVVDINLRDDEVQGTTWLSLFSPRVQAYTVGIDPSPDWVPGTDDDNFGQLVSTLNAPDNSIGGIDRPTAQSFFRRPFQYEGVAAGLIGVPVPVWASRSFTGSWRARVKGKNLVTVSENFGRNEARDRLTGSITSHLPTELEEVSVIYRSRRYDVGRLPSGSAVQLDAFHIQDNEQADAQALGGWLKLPFAPMPIPKRTSSPPREKQDKKMVVVDDSQSMGQSTLRANDIIKPILFYSHEALGRTDNNSGLRQLDQAWRVRGVHVAVQERQHLDEVLLIGRVKNPPESAEEVSKAGVTATRLWLGTLPGDGPRESLQGFLGQDTYVRIYIPVPRK